MIYLIFSVLSSSLLYVIFKLFERYNINNVQAITVNYFSAFALGFYYNEVSISVSEVIGAPWILGAVFLGLLFILVFYIMAITSQKNGLSVTSVASKMSVVIPVSFGLIVYNESIGLLKITGILLALVAVYLSSVKSRKGLSTKNLLFPILLFFGSGTIDTTLKFLETNYVQPEMIPIFSSAIFSFAAIFGLLFLLFKKNSDWKLKSIIAGLLLGIPNYYSIFFLLKALSSEGLESSTVFTVNHVSILALSTLIGLVAFKEKMYFKNWIGIALAIISIFLIIQIA
ncbi:MAG TPA: EamA family transporter [Flavobacteriaceae bacterium]|nr:EamA family transporter [Flavobacteriaceae bacterium]